MMSVVMRTGGGVDGIVGDGNAACEVHDAAYGNGVCDVGGSDADDDGAGAGVAGGDHYGYDVGGDDDDDGCGVDVCTDDV